MQDYVPRVREIETREANGKSLHARRMVAAELQDRDVVSKLFETIAPRYAERPGGYTRIIKQHYRRLGDAGATAV